MTSKVAGLTPDVERSTLLPHFIAIRNGDDIHIDTVREGNEHVLGARFADANLNYWDESLAYMGIAILLDRLEG